MKSEETGKMRQTQSTRVLGFLILCSGSISSGMALGQEDQIPRSVPGCTVVGDPLSFIELQEIVPGNIHTSEISTGGEFVATYSPLETVDAFGLVSNVHPQYGEYRQSYQIRPEGVCLASRSQWACEKIAHCASGETNFVSWREPEHGWSLTSVNTARESQLPLIDVARDIDTGMASYATGDYAAAFHALIPFANNGNAEAQFTIGLMHVSGPRAVKWYSRAAEQGHVKAQWNLAVINRMGLGVPVNVVDALKWYHQAAEQGHVEAQFELGIMYSHVEGVTHDPVSAANWYRKAAGQGHSEAQFNLGGIYRHGVGVPRDYVTAHMWFNIASANGDASGALNRDSVARQMQPSDVSEAQRRATRCMATNYQNCR